MSDGVERRARDPLAPGHVLEGKYRVVKRLGGGAMGVVYEGFHERLEKRVAIKVLRPDIADEDGRDRFEAEARAAAAVGHPNIVAVSDLGRTPEGLLYFVMDLLKGETLGQRLDRVGRIGVESAVAIAVDVLEGLSALHALSLVHRDIKPDNIFLAQPPAGREIAKILDFGIAKAIAGTARRSHGTRVGVAVGTPHYMAPEQAMASPDIDGRVDLWAMGVVLYEMLSGQKPFEAEDALGVLHAVVTTQPTPLGSRCPQAPAALVNVIEQALAKTRQRRPATAAEMEARLKAALGGAPVALPPGPVGMDLDALDAALDPGALESAVLVDLSGNDIPAVAPPGETIEEPPAIVSLAALAPSPPLPRLATPAPPAAAAAEPPVPRRRFRPVWVIAPVVAVVALLAFARLHASGHGAAHPEASDPEEPAESAPRERALVRFEVTPATTRVFLDGLQLPSNPVALPKGERHIVTAVADGYQMVEQEFQVRDAMVLRLKLERERGGRRHP